MVTLLLDHPDQFDLLRADRRLIPGFIEEAMRYENITTHFPRQTTEDAVLEGAAIPEGSIVFGMIFAADRDPSRWDNPHDFDVTRHSKPSLAFSAGAHSCLGAQVARLTISCLIQHLIDDLPNLHWDPEKPHPKITGNHRLLKSQRIIVGLSLQFTDEPPIWRDSPHPEQGCDKQRHGHNDGGRISNARREREEKV